MEIERERWREGERKREREYAHTWHAHIQIHMYTHTYTHIFVGHRSIHDRCLPRLRFTIFLGARSLIESGVHNAATRLNPVSSAVGQAQDPVRATPFAVFCYGSSIQYRWKVR